MTKDYIIVIDIACPGTHTGRVRRRQYGSDNTADRRGGWSLTGNCGPGLNNRGRIKPEVADRIRQIAEEMGYKPNQLGRALSMSKNNIKIGVILQAAETPFMQCVLEGIERAKDEVDSLGGTVLLCKIPHISGRDTIDAMEHMRSEGVSAIAMVPIEEEEIKAHINLFVEEYHIHCDF